MGRNFPVSSLPIHHKIKVLQVSFLFLLLILKKQPDALGQLREKVIYPLKFFASARSGEVKDGGKVHVMSPESK